MKSMTRHFSKLFSPRHEFIKWINIITMLDKLLLRGVRTIKKWKRKKIWNEGWIIDWNTIGRKIDQNNFYNWSKSNSRNWSKRYRKKIRNNNFDLLLYNLHILIYNFLINCISIYCFSIKRILNHFVLLVELLYFELMLFEQKHFNLFLCVLINWISNKFFFDQMYFDLST